MENNGEKINKLNEKCMHIEQNQWNNAKKKSNQNKHRTHIRTTIRETEIFPMNLFRWSSFKWIRLRFINHANISHLFVFHCMVASQIHSEAVCQLIFNWNIAICNGNKINGWWYVRLINESGTYHLYIWSLHDVFWLCRIWINAK